MGSIFIILGILIYIYAFDHRSALPLALARMTSLTSTRQN